MVNSQIGTRSQNEGYKEIKSDSDLLDLRRGDVVRKAVRRGIIQQGHDSTRKLVVFKADDKYIELLHARPGSGSELNVGSITVETHKVHTGERYPKLGGKIDYEPVHSRLEVITPDRDVEYSDRKKVLEEAGLWL